MSSSPLTTGILIIVLILAILAIFAALYIIAAYRRISITARKIDYLVEDLTYKSELMNSSVEILSRISNYLDAFDLVMKKNIKSGTRLVARNRDVIYKLLDKVKKFADN